VCIADASQIAIKLLVVLLCLITQASKATMLHRSVSTVITR
jgi:hypothetical protein